MPLTNNTDFRCLLTETTLAIVEFDLDADDYTCVTCSITFATRLQFLTHRLEDHQAQKGNELSESQRPAAQQCDMHYDELVEAH